MAINREHQIVFVAGLHRSGTTLLARCMAEHPDASGFDGTGVIEDEGQFLQSVYPPARVWGGPGRFGLIPDSHWTESHPLATGENAITIFQEWSRHWDLSKRVLIEKSPPNVTKVRFLKKLFPDSKFVVQLRHPIAVSLATEKWAPGVSFSQLIEHWCVCHEILKADVERIGSTHAVAYEKFVADPNGTLESIDSFLGAAPHHTELRVRQEVNHEYFDRWRQASRGLLSRWSQGRTIFRYENRVRAFGYSLKDLDICDFPSISSMG